jgi:hypothetical protein
MGPTDAQPTQAADLLLAGGVTVTMDVQRTVFNPGAVAVRDNQIVAVGPRDAIAAAYHAARTMDEPAVRRQVRALAHDIAARQRAHA